MKIGIDFGHTNTFVAEIINGKPTLTLNSRKSNHTSSVVAIIDDLPFVGDEISKYCANEDNIVSRMKGIISRYHDNRLLEQYCKDWRINVAYENGVPKFCLKGGKGFTVEEIVAFLFSYVTRGLKNIDGAVITVPSSFDDVQRQIIMDAADITGLKVLRLLDETTAAAKAFAMREHAEWKQVEGSQKLLVFQMGGGSTDIAIFKVKGKTVKLLGNKSSQTIGGDDFVLNMMKDVDKGHSEPLHYKEWVKLLKECEQQKKNLGLSDNVRIKTKEIDLTLSRNQFEIINKQLLDDIEDMMTEALSKAANKIDAQEISKYILVGSGTLLPSVADIVAKRIGKDKICELLNANDAAVIGATHVAQEFGTTFSRKRKERRVSPGRLRNDAKTKDWDNDDQSRKSQLNSIQLSFKDENKEQELSKKKKTVSSLIKKKKRIEEKKSIKMGALGLISLIEAEKRMGVTPEQDQTLDKLLKEARVLVTSADNIIDQTDDDYEKNLKKMKELLNLLRAKFNSVKNHIIHTEGSRIITGEMCSESTEPLNSNFESSNSNYENERRYFSSCCCC